jgi:hypothetical protein
MGPRTAQDDTRAASTALVCARAQQDAGDGAGKGPYSCSVLTNSGWGWSWSCLSSSSHQLGTSLGHAAGGVERQQGKQHVTAATCAAIDSVSYV